MGRKTSSIEKEVNKIRLEIYEETKHMTNEEFDEYIRRNTEDVIKEYGFKVVSSIDEV